MMGRNWVIFFYQVLKWRWSITVCYFNALSWKEFILLLRLLLCSIQTRGQDPKRNIIYAFITVFLFSRHMYEAVLANALSFWLAFLQRLFMWSSKESFKSKIIPSSSFLFSDIKVWPTILALTLSFPENSTWLFPLFIFV